MTVHGYHVHGASRPDNFKVLRSRSGYADFLCHVKRDWTLLSVEKFEGLRRHLQTDVVNSI